MKAKEMRIAYKLDGSCRWFGWFKRFYRRMEDHRLEKKFRAGMRYSDYGVSNVEPMHILGKTAHISDIVSHRYCENDHIQKDKEKLESINDVSVLLPQKNFETCVLTDGTTFSPEIQNGNVGSPLTSLHIVSDDKDLSSSLSNHKHIHDLYCTSMDAGAGVRASAPSRQSSYSSFSSICTNSKLGLLFLSEAMVKM